MITWVLAKNSKPDGIHLLRIAKFETTFSFEKSPERLHIIWTYRSGSTSTPTDTDLQEMEVFENLFCEKLEKTNTAQLVITFTEPSYREYVFYTNNVDTFLKLLNLLPNQGYTFPIEVSGEPDVSGEFYRSYANKLLTAT